jgi:hypothetical protein
MPPLLSWSAAKCSTSSNSFGFLIKQFLLQKSVALCIFYDVEPLIGVSVDLIKKPRQVVRRSIG